MYFITLDILDNVAIFSTIFKHWKLNNMKSHSNIATLYKTSAYPTIQQLVVNK